MKPLLPILASLAIAISPQAQSVPAQSTAAQPDLASDPVAFQLTTLRDAFAAKLSAAGVACPIPPPKLILQNVKSWGNYDSQANTLTTPLWQQLSPQEQSSFYRIAGPNPTREDERREFESGIHHWVFIHELSHWAQICLHQYEDRMPYDLEYGANRIALAYWREADNKLLNHILEHFEDIQKFETTPLPQGQDVEEYFNTNYDKLAPTPAYAWFQSQMITDLAEKRPKPTFKESLQLAVYQP
jgi:hypothetical protein